MSYPATPPGPLSPRGAAAMRRVELVALGLALALGATLVTATGASFLPSPTPGVSEPAAIKLTACLHRHGWQRITEPNRLIDEQHTTFITGWSGLGPPSEAGYAIMNSLNSHGGDGRFTLIAIGGRGMPEGAEESVLRARVQANPREFDGVLVWRGSPDAGDSIRSNCASEAVPFNPNEGP